MPECPVDRRRMHVPLDSCATRLRIATYNVHQWVGADGRPRVGRILSVIRGLEADVIALQEVLLPWRGFTIADLARETGMEAIPGRTLNRGDAEYGNALLTTVPIRSVQGVNLTVSPFEPRGAILASLTVDGLPVGVAATHLGRRLRERMRQVRALMRYVEALQGVTILLGDLNEWIPVSPVLRRLWETFGRQPAPASFPARFPVLALDRILVRPPAFARPPRAVATRAARRASDHLPVQATLCV